MIAKGFNGLMTLGDWTELALSGHKNRGSRMMLIPERLCAVRCRLKAVAAGNLWPTKAGGDQPEWSVRGCSAGGSPLQARPVQQIPARAAAICSGASPRRCM